MTTDPKTPSEGDEITAALKQAYETVSGLVSAAQTIMDGLDAAVDKEVENANGLSQQDILALRDAVNQMPDMKKAWQVLHDVAQVARKRTQPAAKQSGLRVFL